MSLFGLLRQSLARVGIAAQNTPTTPLGSEFVRFATNRSAGVTRNGRDSRPKYLGVKRYGDEFVIPGNIILRQRGVKFSAGEGVGMGKDHTIYALKAGYVRFEKDPIKPKKKMVTIIDTKMNVPKNTVTEKVAVEEVIPEAAAVQESLTPKPKFSIMKH